MISLAGIYYPEGYDLITVQYLVGLVTDELSVSFYSFGGLAADDRNRHYDQSRY
jgi:hypothetical protein